MTVDVYESCRKLLSFAPFFQVDDHAEKRLRQSIDIHIGESKEEDIASIRFIVNGKEYPFIYDAIADVKEPKETEIIFSDLHYNPSWLFNIPTMGMKILPEGVGYLVMKEPAQSDDEDGKMANVKAMFRGYIPKHYRPQSLKAELSNTSEELDVMPYGLQRLEQHWGKIREEGVIPILLRICAYTQTTRHAYMLDLYRNKLIRDYREDKIPQVNHLQRQGLQFFHVDKIMTMKDVPELSKKIFEIVFESKEVSGSDLAYMLHVNEKQLAQYIGVLSRRDFIKTLGKPPNERYIANIEGMSKIQ